MIEINMLKSKPMLVGISHAYINVPVQNGQTYFSVTVTGNPGMLPLLVKKRIKGYIPMEVNW